MSLAALPAVLLQLLCQQLDRKSLLHLARCCRSTLAAASSTVAWQFAGLIPLCASPADAADVACFPSSLLRFADVRLRVCYRWDDNDGAALLLRVSTVPRVINLELDLNLQLSAFGSDPPQLLSQFLALPNLEGVRQLHVTLGFNATHTALLAQHMRGLHTLFLPAHYPDFIAPSLAGLPSLTRLAIGEPTGTVGGALTTCQQLISCPRLTQLRLNNWKVDRITMLLTQPALASRRATLELTEFRYFHMGLAPSVFAGLVALRTLWFAACPSAAEIVQVAAAQTRSLTFVRLQDPYSTFWQASQTGPYLAHLHEALKQRDLLCATDPAFAPLCIEIRMQADVDWRLNLDSGGRGQYWTVMKEQAEALAQDTRDAKCKMTLVIDPPQENQRDRR